MQPPGILTGRAGGFSPGSETGLGPGRMGRALRCYSVGAFQDAVTSEQMYSGGRQEQSETFRDGQERALDESRGAASAQETKGADQALSLITNRQQASE